MFCYLFDSSRGNNLNRLGGNVLQSIRACNHGAFRFSHGARALFRRLWLPLGPRFQLYQRS